jgi:hypothetical protein
MCFCQSLKENKITVTKNPGSPVAAGCQVKEEEKHGKTSDRSGTSLLSHSGAIELMTVIGYSAEEAGSQVDRFPLNPCRHLCYNLGRNEFAGLRKRCGNRLGRDVFHFEILLQKVNYSSLSKYLKRGLYDSISFWRTA